LQKELSGECLAAISQSRKVKGGVAFRPACCTCKIVLYEEEMLFLLKFSYAFSGAAPTPEEGDGTEFSYRPLQAARPGSGP
jgi:hypothetical protein